MISQYLKNAWSFRLHIILALWMMLLGMSLQAVELVIYFHNDALGSPIMATDETGKIIWREEYQPYGKRIIQQDTRTGKPYQSYTGKPEQTSTGLIYLGSRWYNPAIGRFYSIDPQGFDEANPQSFNRYAYGNNNPYRFVDPNGESPLDLVFLLADVAKLGIAVYGGHGIGEAAADIAADIVGLALPVPGGGQAIKAARTADKVGDAVKGGDNTIYRMGTSKESATRLGNKSQEAENMIGKHGVSGSTTKPDVPCSSASCSSLEAAGFKVTPTPTRRDPNHVTIEMPKPVTKEATDKFNSVFGR